MEQDPEGQSWGYGMTSMLTVPCYIAGMCIVLFGEKNVSNSLIDWQDMLVKDSSTYRWPVSVPWVTCKTFHYIT